MHEATRAVRDFARDAEINEDDASRLAIVVEELVTNLYDHGGLNAEDVFDMELSTSDTEINLVLVDRGRPFDPRLVRNADAIPSRGGGAGLKLVCAWASHIDYRTLGTYNRLSVLLPAGRNRPREADRALSTPYVPRWDE